MKKLIALPVLALCAFLTYGFTVKPKPKAKPVTDYTTYSLKICDSTTNNVYYDLGTVGSTSSSGYLLNTYTTLKYHVAKNTCSCNLHASYETGQVSFIDIGMGRVSSGLVHRVEIWELVPPATNFVRVACIAAPASPDVSNTYRHFVNPAATAVEIYRKVGTCPYIP
ncbi:MAG: hypothetical protein EOP49_49550 [Sphingobacteriales bacterium]|nr:MAG: hypothetical protein EOP49_49550 [Sphingobacteriales bacterium]